MFNHLFKITIVFPSSAKFKQQVGEARRFLKTVLLQEKEHVLAKDLAHGEKRKLELAMLLALKRMCYYLMSQRQVYQLKRYRLFYK